ncbi:hypothetical protein B7P33_03105 [Sediminicola luteus]|uniref:Glycine-rich domain-containing protein n=2 Tax=Sediminicola luteus TaxID=319238 RepID=A0A2A4GEY0_9FLAO|nr:hypothetical protein B7P33_03105 [Sediminicola luteus]
MLGLFLKKWLSYTINTPKDPNVKAMKKRLYLLCPFLIFYACSNSDDSPETISGTLEYTTIGNHQFTLEAQQITATITLIGGGGGGGGGAPYESGVNATSGGGGGGAGQLLIMESVALKDQTVYTVFVPPGGNGGNVGFPGGDGLAASVSEGNTVLLEGLSGKPGQPGPKDAMEASSGGAGYPNGENGGGGSTLDANGNATAGVSGLGGNNGTAYGYGGNGGIGTGFNNNQASPTMPGTQGGPGYVKIEWTGIQN